MTLQTFWAKKPSIWDNFRIIQKWWFLDPENFIMTLQDFHVWWGGAQQYLLSTLQVQQLTAARTVYGFGSWGGVKRNCWKSWLVVSQTTNILSHRTPDIQNHQHQETHGPYQALSSDFPYRTRSAATGQIREDENLRKSSYKYRARQSFNSVPQHVRTGSIATVKKKLKLWVKTSVSIE